MSALVLSLFPGLDLLGRGFEAEGFTIVRGPDLVWGGDVRSFHPPPGRFDGVIGGPPCQAFSTLGQLSQLGNGVTGGQRHGDQIPEFERCVREAQPAWFVMENVMHAPLPQVYGYAVTSMALNNRWLGEDQNRLRRFSFGARAGADVGSFALDGLVALESPIKEPTVLAGHGPGPGRRVRRIMGRTWQESARLQGLTAEEVAQLAADAPFTVHGYKQVIGNAVSIPMARAIARAVRRALGGQASDADLAEALG